MSAHAIAHLTAATSGGDLGYLDDEVITWRVRRLLDAGFEPGQARELAATPGIDLHAVLDLIGRGCPPRLAARILSPGDEPVDEPPHRPGGGRDEPA
ncbi:MAG TPA: hypothetical protein VLC50_04430 [Actinomycetes bacterium]|nr:hypothetical protein [Actinomycetes bacterium]